VTGLLPLDSAWPFLAQRRSYLLMTESSAYWAPPTFRCWCYAQSCVLLELFDLASRWRSRWVD